MSKSRKVRLAVLLVLCIGVTMAIAAVQNAKGIHPYDDVRPQVAWSGGEVKDVTKVAPAELKKMIPTFWFNQDTVWPKSCKAYAAQVLEDAKNPGLGIRALHKSGFTGKGVNVAIIDQPLFDDHPELKGKIAAYKNFCTGEGSDSSMHGPAVASILVGKATGTAPGARLYYASVPSWSGDTAYYAKALDWIIEQNKKLPAGSKIRVVSISACPAGPGSPFKKNNDQWEPACHRADKAGILVLECSQNKDRGIIGPAYFEAKVSESSSACEPGFPGSKAGRIPDVILVPTAPRTTAEEYQEGVCRYQYTGDGGLSWAIPYAAGVLAMGWQVRPELSKEEMVHLLGKSAYVKSGNNIINPREFIRLVKGYKSSKS